MPRVDLRVAHVVPARFGPDGILGGAERYAFELARAMAQAVPTTLVAFGDRDARETVDGLTVRVIGRPWYVRGQRTNPVSVRLFSALRPATVVHCHQQHVLASSLAALYCRLTGRRVFVSDLGGGGWDVSAFVSTDRWYHAHLHLSEYSRLVFGHEFDPRAHVILGGVDAERFSPDPGVPRTDRVLYVGRILPHKGIDYLIEALPEGMPLDVIGSPADPAYLADLRQAARARDKDVTFRHDVTDDELVDAYRRALCVVLPSVYHTSRGTVTRVPELLGQTLLEAMACGTPVVATEVASLPEVVDDPFTGFLVPPNDPRGLRKRLERLRDHADVIGKLGEAGRRRVLEHFTWPAVVQRCLAIYEHPKRRTWDS